MVTVSSTTGEQFLDDPLVGALETVEWLGAGDLDTGTVVKNEMNRKKKRKKNPSTRGQWTSTNMGLAQARPNYQVS